MSGKKPSLIVRQLRGGTIGLNRTGQRGRGERAVPGCGRRAESEVRPGEAVHVYRGKQKTLKSSREAYEASDASVIGPCTRQVCAVDSRKIDDAAFGKESEQVWVWERARRLGESRCPPCRVWPTRLSSVAWALRAPFGWRSRARCGSALPVESRVISTSPLFLSHVGMHPPP